MKLKKISTVVTTLTFVGGMAGLMGGEFVGDSFISSSSAATTSGESQTITDSTGRVTFTVTPIYDGTGFGTAAECKVNTAHGYPEGDNNAHDGVVCYGDQVGYRIDYSVAPSDTPTILNVLPSGSTTAIDGSNAMSTNNNIPIAPLSPWCQGGTGLIHTGVDNGQGGCRMTFPASAGTGTSSFTTYVDVPRDSSTDFDYRMKFNITDVNKQNLRELTSTPTRVVGGPNVDPMIVRVGDPVYKIVNGVPGMYSDYRITYEGILDTGIAKKGMYYEQRNYIGNFNIDMTSFPSGTQVTTAPGWSYSNGKLSAENYTFKSIQNLGYKSIYDEDWGPYVNADGKGTYTTNF